jgi:uncharacterized repeat protein (TIGR01451 family)
MEKELRNTVGAKGNYNSIPTSITSVASVVTMVEGLSITKTADKLVWADGELTYTIVITNDADQTYENVVVTDILNTTLVEFVDKSVTIDSVQATTGEYEYNDGTLTVNINDIVASESKTVTFKVTKKNI